MARLYCTKTHRHHGVWDDPSLQHRVLLEARFVVVGYGNDRLIESGPFRTPGFDGPEGTEWRDRPWVL